MQKTGAYKPGNFFSGYAMNSALVKAKSITDQTYYRWRKQHGGMGTDQLKVLKRLQK